MTARICVECGRAFQPQPGRRRNDRCPTHQQAFNTRDNTRRNQHPRQRVYKDPRWARCRTVVLERDEHTCRYCGNSGNIVDHIFPIAVILEQGGNPFDPDECQLLCQRCSGVKDGARGTAA